MEQQEFSSLVEYGWLAHADRQKYWVSVDQTGKNALRAWKYSWNFKITAIWLMHS